jgi:hypothetical protein
MEEDDEEGFRERDRGGERIAQEKNAEEQKRGVRRKSRGGEKVKK